MNEYGETDTCPSAHDTLPSCDVFMKTLYKVPL